MPQTSQPALEGQSQGAREAYRTDRGRMLRGLAENALSSDLLDGSVGNIDLVFTSPPFPLNRKKAYGNKTGKEYLDWLKGFASQLRDVISEEGSVVIELGNGWESGKPTMSTLPLEALLAFKDAGNFELCQQFVAFNPARLPAPAQWVNIERIRVKDAFTHVWWLSKTERPAADNRRVLQEYSDSMKKLLETGEYNAGERPSEYNVGEESFLKDNGGSIPPNFINPPKFEATNIIKTANTRSTGPYFEYCKEHGIDLHPARMSPDIPEFFIRFLTEEGGLVLDPFAGSNMTGAVAERLNRRWIGIEEQWEYIRGSIGRFLRRPADEKLPGEKRENPRLRCQAIAEHDGSQCSFGAQAEKEYCGHHTGTRGQRPKIES